jgi:transcriptional regulator with XRE-family HTH domain
LNIGENIKKYRLLRKFSIKDLAREIAVSESTISRYESGKREPNMETLKKICINLGITINDLLELDIVLSKKIIDYLEIPILKAVGPMDTLEVLSEDLNIDYSLLEKCINQNEELPLEVQKELLQCLSDVDYPSFLDFIERYKNQIKKSDELDKYVTELFVMKIHDMDKNSLELLKSYILLVFDKKVSKILTDDTLRKLQKETTKFLEFKLYEIETAQEKEGE